MAHFDQRQFQDVTCVNSMSHLSGWQKKIRLFIRAELTNCILTDELPTLCGAAKFLGVSVRALQRNLAREGSTFSAELDAVRAERAIKGALDTQIPVLSLAMDLGYSDQSNFTRAFRRWFGMSPAQFRGLELKAGCRNCEMLVVCLRNCRN